ncbi:MAG: hypothetical protein ABIK31_00370 [candidate division WOR-3 bacterium]
MIKCFVYVLVFFLYAFYGLIWSNSFGFVPISDTKDSTDSFVKQDCDLLIECVELNRESLLFIQAQRKLYRVQMLEVSEFLQSGIKVELGHKKGRYVLRQSGTLKVYDIDSNYDVYVLDVVNFNRETYFEFFPELNPRPYPYFSSIFKLGGGLILQDISSVPIPDIMILYEFFSFDKLFGVYGYSMNFSFGVRSVGASLGYQFYQTQLFKNTSFLIGYGYDFMLARTVPYVAVSLNF